MHKDSVDPAMDGEDDPAFADKNDEGNRPDPAFHGEILNVAPAPVETKAEREAALTKEEDKEVHEIKEEQPATEAPKEEPKKEAKTEEPREEPKKEAKTEEPKPKRTMPINSKSMAELIKASVAK